MARSPAFPGAFGIQNDNDVAGGHSVQGNFITNLADDNTGFPPFNTTDMAGMTYQQPRVIQRVVRTTNKNPGSHNPRVSIKTYDRSTDSDIFSLGSAFKDGNLNIDDFFKSFSSKLDVDPGEAPGQSVQRVTRTVQGDDGRSTRVTTITKVGTPRVRTTTDRSTFTPFNLPATNNGSHQQLGFEDGSETPAVKLNEDRISQYEGVTLEDTEPTEPLLPKGTQQSFDSCEAETQLDDTTTTHVDRQTDQQQETTEEFSSGEEMHTTRLLWQQRKLKKRKLDRIYQMKKTKNKTKSHVKEKGHSGMTTSEVTVPGEEKKLPAVQLMVLNFNKMLDSDREQFIETMFRAVKLNGIHVVKILCQLVNHKGLKLSSEEMREPESSATVLHVALLCNHEELAEYLIGLNDKDLIMSVYTKKEYRRQTTLHVAVANGNQRLVNKLLASLKLRDKKALINTVADGSYFSDCHPDGQLCLSAASWAGYGDMLVILAKNGANFAMADLEGNTLMHRLMIASSEHPDKMNYCLMVEKVFASIGEWAKRCRYKTQIPEQVALEQKQKQINTFHKLLNVQNDHGETPLVLAAKHGSGLLTYLMNMETIYKIPQTKLGSISWVTYDVTDITTFALDSYNKFSVLHVLAHNSGKLSRHANLEEDADAPSFLDTEPIKSLIEMKWGVYRWVYVFWMFLHMAFVTLFTYCTFDEYSAELVFVGFHDEGLVTAHPETELRPVKHYLCVFLILPLVYIILEFIDWFGIYPYSISYMQNKRLYMKLFNRMKSEWVITGNGPYRFVCLSYAIFTISWFVMYESRFPGQDIMMSMALLFGWIFNLFFTRGCRVTSRFSIMIQKMFFRDLMYFLAVYIVILSAFSISISAVYSFDNASSAHFPSVMYQMLNIITDLDQRTPGSFEKGEGHPLFTKMLLTFYAIVAVILLMNMLIAMMNTSYETVRITKCNLHKQQQLSIMLMIERRLFWFKGLCRKSERDIWHKEWEEGSVRAYVDVTTTTTTQNSHT